MQVWALLWHNGIGSAAPVELLDFDPGPQPPRPVQVVAARPALAAAAPVAEGAMMPARQWLLKRGYRQAQGPFLFYLDLAGAPAVAPADSLGLAAALAFAALLTPQTGARRIAATGTVDLRGHVGRVDHAADKIRAALDLRDPQEGNFVFGPGDLIFYPAANRSEVRAAGLEARAAAREIGLVPVTNLAEALPHLAGTASTLRERVRRGLARVLTGPGAGLRRLGERVREGLRRTRLGLGRGTRRSLESLAVLLVALFALGLPACFVAYPFLLYPWPWPPSVAVTAPALDSRHPWEHRSAPTAVSWQDPQVSTWLEKPAKAGGPQGKDLLYFVEGQLRYPFRYALPPGRLRLEAAVVTAGGTYPPDRVALRPWLGRFRVGVWLDRRLPDANLRLALYNGERLLAVREISFRDAPPAPQWSLNVRNGVLELGYRQGDGFPQIAALHLDSGALRLTYLPDGGWGTALYPFAWWENGRFVRGARVLLPEGQPLFRAVADAADPRCLRLRVALEGADWEVLLRPPEEGLTTAACRVRLLRLPRVAPRPVPGEAFQVVHLASMYVDENRWDAREAVCRSPGKATAGAAKARAVLPASGSVFDRPREADSLALVGGSSAWKKGAPTMEVGLEEPARALVQGWVTAAADPNLENVALWAGLDKPLTEWRLQVTARRAETPAPEAAPPQPPGTASGGPEGPPAGPVGPAPRAEGTDAAAPGRSAAVRADKPVVPVSEPVPGRSEPPPAETATEGTPAVRIQEPTSGSGVARFVEVRGTCRGTPAAGAHLWLAVHPHSCPGLWWPQAEISPSAEGGWRLGAWAGQEREAPGAAFDIAVWLVDEATHQQLQAWLRKGREAGSYPGMPQPAGAQTLDLVTVHRR